MNKYTKESGYSRILEFSNRTLANGAFIDTTENNLESQRMCIINSDDDPTMNREDSRYSFPHSLSENAIFKFQAKHFPRPILCQVCLLQISAKYRSMSFLDRECIPCRSSVCVSELQRSSIIKRCTRTNCSMVASTDA